MSMSATVPRAPPCSRVSIILSSAWPLGILRQAPKWCIINGMSENRPSRLRPAGPILVTRVRTPPQIRTASVTVLFADLRGYTGMVERLPAAQVVPLLDEFMRVLVGAVQKFGGEVYNIAGDG